MQLKKKKLHTQLKVVKQTEKFSLGPLLVFTFKMNILPREEEPKFGTRLGNITKPCLKKTKAKKNNGGGHK